MVPLANDDVQVRLAGGLGVADALLEDVLGLFNELPVQVNGVLRYAAGSVVLPEDELRRLLVVVGLLLLMPLALIGQLLSSGSIAALIRFMGLRQTVHMLTITNGTRHMTRS